VNTAASVMRM